MCQTAEDEQLLESYRVFAKFLSDTIGVPCSTVLYRIYDSETDGEVHAMYGPDTGRDVGDRLTVFLREVLQELKRTGAPGVTHVDTEASTAQGRVKLNIFAIRNSRDKVVGLFIICMQIDLFYDVLKTVTRYLGYQVAGDTSIKAIDEKGGTLSLSTYIQKLIQDEIDAVSVPAERMTIEEKRKLVRRLEKMEVFYVRDSVKITANLLGVSVPTVYRLLKKEPKDANLD